MNKDEAIEEIRQTRHEISVRFDHDVDKMIQYYHELESKYQTRIKKKNNTKVNHA